MGQSPKDINPENLRMVSLQDKYELEDGVAYMSGTQALVRLPIVQRRRDVATGLNTAGFVSGYRGSPLAGYDREIMRAKKYLDPLNVEFHPGVNEDLAATSVWGTQHVNLFPKAKFDGVFGIWYGKAPGVDRSGDVFRHANAAGTSPLGGVLALAGDDHACKSSTLPAQSDHSFYSMMLPMLYPASVDEFVEYGLLGIAMSRYSGCWTAYKVTSDTVETSGTVDLSREHRDILYPDETEFEMPPGGVHIRLNDKPRDMDWRLQNYKLFACHAFARKNNLDRIVLDSPAPRFGIITSGKSYGDVRQALVELGITEQIAHEIGLRVYKVGMPWPLEPQGVQAFCEGLDEILIVEEKRELIENQLKQQIFNWHADRRPVVVGKYDEKGARLLPLHNEQSVGLVCKVIARRLSKFYRSETIDNCLRFYDDLERREANYTPANVRTPFFCSGCPHNTSTKVPDGSYAFAGIGCHYMAQWMDRDTGLYTHMGGEGVPWIGHAPFTEDEHVFTNLGDGTYFHSGILAIRASVAAKVNITYKILYNDAVAMTGGQSLDGDMPVWRVAQQMASEGVAKTWIVTETPETYEGVSQIPSGVRVYHRDHMPKIQEEARATKGCTVIIYDQGCAAEKRRLRKRGKAYDPDQRIMINSSVCEGCGDCSVQSNCISVQPLETEYGRKRTIHQTSCNKDFSCLKGFCPSFVTVKGGSLRKDKAEGASLDDVFAKLPMPELPNIDSSYNILVAGIGGTGVLTVGALVGMAAHVEGKHSAVLDMTGLAQKGGSVLSHVRLSHSKETLRTGHIVSGGTDLLLAYDIVAASALEAFDTYSSGRTAMVVNDNHTPVSEFVINNAVDLYDQEIIKTLSEHTRDERHFVPSSKMTGMLLGEETYMNIFMLGYAWQKGLIPLSFESLDQVISLNGKAVERNKQAFAYGRLAAHDKSALDDILKTHPAYKAQSEEESFASTIDELVAKRIPYLTEYQNPDYAMRYKDMVDHVRGYDPTDDHILGEAVARYYHKLLAYKDEYEVARLYTNGDFLKSVKAQFQGDYKLSFNLAPPMLPGKDDATGRPKKREFGPWMLSAFGVLAKFKFLRGTVFDIFGYTQERKDERALIKEYEYFIEVVEQHIASGNASDESLKLCADLLSIPDEIRGFGPVKEDNIKIARTKAALLIKRIQHFSKNNDHAPSDDIAKAA